jgi:hypothetical protein
VPELGRIEHDGRRVDRLADDLGHAECPLRSAHGDSSLVYWNGSEPRGQERLGDETDAVINLALLRADISRCAVAPGFVG